MPTLSGWLVLLACGVAVTVGAAHRLYPFLSPNRPVGHGVLVVEGWLGEPALLQAIEHYRHGDYSQLVATGGPIVEPWSRSEPFETYADRAAHFVRDHGIAANEVVAVSSQGWRRDRTWQAALSVRYWLSQTGLAVRALDVVSDGPHSRRTWQLYRRAFRQEPKVAEVEIGVLSAAPASYDPSAWWETSSGTRAVVTEAIAWGWSTCCFREMKEISDGGIGIAIYSQYPAEDQYLRLRQRGWGSFYIAPHPDGVIQCAGQRDSGVVPYLNTWYRFRFQAWDDSRGTRLRAKVWKDSEPEPSIWKVDCVDEERTFGSGKPGLWSMGLGLKLWDDLEVRPLQTIDTDGNPSDRRDIHHTDDAAYVENFDGYSDSQDPEGWFDTGPMNSLQESPALFKTFLLSGGETAYGTSSDASNIHSHLSIGESARWRSYEFSGVMAIADGADRIGPHGN